MDIDKLAHALGVVFCRPPLGELDLAPGPMHVDADKEIDGAVAAGLVIVKLALTPLAREAAGDRPPPWCPAPASAHPPAPRGWAGPPEGCTPPPAGSEVAR